MGVAIIAIYRNGVFRPREKPDVPDNQEVELAITWPVRLPTGEGSASLASLQGVWSHLTDEDLDRMEAAVREIRRHTAAKFERLILNPDEAHRGDG